MLYFITKIKKAQTSPSALSFLRTVLFSQEESACNRMEHRTDILLFSCDVIGVFRKAFSILRAASLIVRCTLIQSIAILCFADGSTFSPELLRPVRVGFRQIIHINLAKCIEIFGIKQKISQKLVDYSAHNEIYLA